LSATLHRDLSSIFHFLSCLRDRMSGPEMVPADLEQLVGVIRQQAMEIVSLRQELVHFRAEIIALRAETAALRAECAGLRSDLTALQADHDDLAAVQAPPTEPIRQPPPVSHPKISLPDKWDGSGTKCEVFLTNLNLVFEFQPSRYPTDRSRIALLTSLLTSLLTGQAAEWATASEVEVDSRLYHLKQGSRSVSRYTTEFRTLAVQTTWSNAALRTAYYEGLSIRLKDELAVRELPDTLEGMIQLALRVDQRMSLNTKSVFRSLTGPPGYQRTPEPSTSHAVAASPPPPPVASEAHSTGAGEPMQIGRTSLRYHEGLDLPSSSGKRTDQVKRGRSSSGPTTAKTYPKSFISRLLLQVSILMGHLRVETTAFVDSGAAGNFIDQAYAAQLGIVNEAFSPITHRTQELTLVIGSHSENIHFYVTKLPAPPIILGHPWLITHDPLISWTSNRIIHWGATCQELCLRAKAPDVDLEAIPVHVARLGCLLIAPCDLAIDLVPGAVPPRGHLYSLSAQEQLAMEEYVAEGLRSGNIRPSSSPAAAGFFFVKKKDGGLRPCVDYRGLNQITVKNRHPLPLINTALDALSGAHFFTKLDLRSTYNLVRIREGDEWKTAFITPTGHCETLVMPFGLCNSPAAFQHFINDVLRDMLGRWCYAYLDDILIYSKTQEEHTQHVRAVLQRLLAHQLFCKLEKCAFHQHTTTFLGFVISAQGVAMNPQKLEAVRAWPLPTSLKQLQRFLGFANFYRRFIRGLSSTAAPLTALTKPSRGDFHLTPEATQAFKSLCHQFTTAPQLNPRQARWALFFEHFNFHLSYRPGSKNTKAVALSRQHQRCTITSEPAPVLPSQIIMAPLRWGLEERVRQAHGQHPPPPDTPAGRLFVPNILRQEVLHPENHQFHRPGLLVEDAEEGRTGVRPGLQHLCPF
ncbi:hypothetical protein M9458_003033, partial [Cirrhinus mrigala]